MKIQLYLWDTNFKSFGYIPWSGITGSYGFIFSCLKNLHTIFLGDSYFIHFFLNNYRLEWSCKE
jgi:hypothetical protein